MAVIQPYGNGGTWQLAVTCASGGCCLLPEGKTLNQVSSNLCALMGTTRIVMVTCQSGREVECAAACTVSVCT